MKEVAASDISARVADLCIRACTVLPPDVIAAIESARDREESSLGRDVLSRLLENAALAADRHNDDPTWTRQKLATRLNAAIACRCCQRR